MSFETSQEHDRTAPVESNENDNLVFGESLFPLMTGEFPTEQEAEMHRRVIPTWLFYSGLFIIAVFGIGLIYIKHHYEAREFGVIELLEPFGHALIIAAFLASTVDLYVKQRLLKEAAEDIAKYLIGYKLPEELQDRIRELMGTTLFRRNVRVRYMMSQSEQNPGKLLIDVEYEFCVENPTRGKLSYIHKMQFPEYLSTVVSEMRCTSNDEKARYCLSTDKIKRGHDSSVDQFLGKSISIKSKPNNPNLKYEFRIRYSYEKFKSDSDYFAFDEPSIGFRMELVPPIPPAIEFTGPYGEVNENTWHEGRIFLRGEHTSFRWIEKKQDNGGSATAIPEN